jgi:hypothetical protein
VPIEEKESYRWLANLRQSTELFGAPQPCVHVGDRESDIYELFCTAQDVGTQIISILTMRIANRIPLIAAGSIRTPEQAEVAMEMGLSLVAVVHARVATARFSFQFPLMTLLTPVFLKNYGPLSNRR